MALFDNVNQGLFQGGMAGLMGSMPNSGMSPYANMLQGFSRGAAMDQQRAKQKAFEALLAGPQRPQAAPTPAPPTGVPSSAALMARFGMPQSPSAPPGAPPALTAARGGPGGVQIAALGPMGSGGAAMGAGGGQATLAPQARPQQAMGASPGPGTGLQGLLASMDPQTRQMVAQLGPEQGTPLLMSMLAQRNKPGAITETQERQNLAAAAGLQPGTPEYSDFMLRGTAAPTPATPALPDIAKLQQYRTSLPAGPQRDEVDARIAKLNAPAKGVNVDFGAPEIGTIPPNYEVYLNEDGRRAMRPILNSPAEADAAAAVAREGTQLQSDVAKAETMLSATSGIRQEFEGANTPVTGTSSVPFAQFSGTPAGRVRSYVGTLQSGAVLGAMQKLKEASASGATGFGAMNEKELGLLIDSVGALNPDTTDDDIFLKTIDRIDNQYKRVIQDIKDNVSPERIRELGLDGLIASVDGVSRETGPAQVTSDEDYNALPSGTEFIGPDGTVRRKP